MSFAEALDILYEDNHVLAVNKPAGWPSAHFDGTDETMDRVVKAYITGAVADSYPLGAGLGLALAFHRFGVRSPWRNGRRGRSSGLGSR